MSCYRSIVYLVVFAVFLTADFAMAAYRKPPFNGSIFGKRGNTAEYDNGKALSSLCEIASEVCAAWFPASENN